uniref:Uncharacterized protein n=1 Tax=Lepeophtheirus salmonis TaxID=72036 RepID=A0A0K2SY25_LEPSM
MMVQSRLIEIQGYVIMHQSCMNCQLNVLHGLLSNTDRF